MDERVTTCAVIERGGRYLLGLRETEGSPNQGRWEFIGGKQRHGEDDAETLKREFLEELGAEVEPKRLLAVHDFENKGTLYHLHAWEAELKGDDFTLSVHSELGWFTPDEIFGLDLVDSDRAVASVLLSRTRPAT